MKRLYNNISGCCQLIISSVKYGAVPTDRQQCYQQNTVGSYSPLAFVVLEMEGIFTLLLPWRKFRKDLKKQRRTNKDWTKAVSKKVKTRKETQLKKQKAQRWEREKNANDILLEIYSKKRTQQTTIAEMSIRSLRSEMRRRERHNWWTWAQKSVASILLELSLTGGKQKFI